MQRTADGNGTAATSGLGWTEATGVAFLYCDVVPGEIHPAPSKSEDLAYTQSSENCDQGNGAAWFRERRNELFNLLRVKKHPLLGGPPPGLVATASWFSSMKPHPTVAAGSAGRVFVAWSEPDEKGSAVVLTRGRKEVW